MTIGVVIPALDEERAIGTVVGDLLALRNLADERIVDHIVVCDNGSTDETARRAAEAGARVVREDRPGYGSACLAGLAALHPVDAVLFTDGDHAFHADEAPRLLDALADGADLAIGSRTLGRREAGALTRSQTFGNAVAAVLIRVLFGQRVTDLGPYRAIRTAALARLGMADRAFGWTVEMQVKAIQAGLATVEVPVDTRARIGDSKISGTLRGAVGAGVGILGTIARLRLRKPLVRRLEEP